MINPETFFFLAVVSQRDAARLFAEPPRAVAVRLRGQAETALDIRQVMVIPAQQDRLPSAALGWLGGGEVAVDTQDSQGTRAAEPFFEVRLKLDADPGIPVFHGRSGQARFEFQPEPLLEQGWRRLRQTLQRRFRL